MAENKTESINKRSRRLDNESTIRYKLIVYTESGILKPNINNGVFVDTSRRFGDVIRSISSSRWMLLDEICSVVWNYEKKMQHPSNRTRASIVTALNDLVERNFVATQ